MGPYLHFVLYTVWWQLWIWSKQCDHFCQLGVGRQNLFQLHKTGLIIFEFTVRNFCFFMIFFCFFSCARGFYGQRCEFKELEHHNLVLRSHTSSKCILGLTHYPCWNVQDDFKKIDLYKFVLDDAKNKFTIYWLKILCISTSF